MKEIITTKKVTLWLAPGSRIARIFFAILLVLIFALIWIVFVYGKYSFDQRVFDVFKLHITPFRTKLMIIVSFLGSHLFLIPVNLILLAYFLIRKNKHVAVRVAMIVISSVLVMSFLKTIFHRVRPGDPLVHGITNFSFPSGHSFMSVAFYGLLIWMAAMYIPNRKKQRIAIACLLLLILAIGISRIYLRVHFATDVIAGFCMGFAWLILSFGVIDKIESITWTRKM